MYGSILCCISNSHMIDYKNTTNLDFYMCITFDFVEILLIEKILALYEVLDEVFSDWGAEESDMIFSGKRIFFLLLRKNINGFYFSAAEKVHQLIESLKSGHMTYRCERSCKKKRQITVGGNWKPMFASSHVD